MMGVNLDRQFADGTVDITVGCSADTTQWQKITRCSLYGTRLLSNANTSITYTSIAGVPGPNAYENNNCNLMRVKGEKML